MGLVAAIPALPVANIASAVEYYRSRFGFEDRYNADDYGIVGRDEVEIHLWAANDPHKKGAEPHLAGSASCRVQVTDVDSLYAELQENKVIHPNGAIGDQPWGREFTTFDLDHNAITFFQRL